MKKFFSALLILLMVLQCFLMAVPTAFAASADQTLADIVTVDDDSVIYYEDEAQSAEPEREKDDVAPLGAATKSSETTLEITKQPISVSVKKGEKAKVSFVAKGDGLTYKWYYKNAGASKFAPTDTFTSNAYETTMNDARNGRQIYCVVTDKYGNSLKTNKVSLVMKTSLEITKQPVSVQAQLGTTAKVSLSVKGEGLTYKWYYKNAGASKFTLTDSFKSNVYSVKMTEARDGRQLYCVVNDKYGNSVTSDIVTITKGAVLKINTQPQSVVAYKGKTAKVSFEASGEGLTYTWYYKNAGASKFVPTDAFASNTYSVSMTSSRNGRQIYCVVADKFGNSVKTNTVTLSMGTPLEITQQPASVTLPAGKVATISFAAKGDGLTYNWYYKNAGNTKFVYTSTFKSNTYSVEMNSARDGRMLYCEVTDKYGNTARTNTVVLDMGTTLKITQQPTSLVVHQDHKAKVSFSVQGDGLTYKWYYKNSGASDFAVTDTFKGRTYTVVMNAHRSGRAVYCVVTDKYGDSIKTDTVTITMDHIYGEWEVYRAATAEKAGVERRSCSVCSYYKDRTIPKLTAVYYITTELGDGVTKKVGVPASGNYTLENPKREGYSFAGWKTAQGDDFSREGVIESDTTVTALWNIDGTDTLRELIDRTNAGVEVIMITSDIVITKPIYISYNTKIYSDGDFSLIRDPNFAGDMFVVGENNKGQSCVVLNRDAVLTLGGGEGTLTIDGNRDNVKVEVVGSAVFATDSSVINLYDGVKIANNKKLGNERIYKYTAFISASTGENAGGAGILNLNATVNMYGGSIENNLVSTVHKYIDNEDGTQSTKESFGCGGGVYNRGQFNMYGGKISNNEALRGGGFYTDRVAYIISGEISGNIAHYYGAAISTSSTQYADLHIGSEGEGKTILIDANYSYRAGGAIYSNTSSPIIIYGNAVFSNNRSDSSGGVIYSAGPITAKNTVFDSNSCYGSGGAIYNHYTKAEFSRRFMELSECTFTNNSANLGGAIILSASDTVADTGLGTYATIKDCNFIGNIATNKEAGSGNGGAIYVTRKSETIISRCLFEDNTASLNAGAVAAHSEAHVDLVDCDFIRNTATYGGGLYTSSESKVELENILFDSNKSVFNENGSGGNGGAVYVSLAKPTFKNVDFVNNSAANHAGAVYVHATTLSFDDTCEFDSNSAGAHGGAFYLTYRNLEDGTKDGSVLKLKNVELKNNTALAGGAISIRSACDAQLNNVKLTGNIATGAEKDAQGGGAVYVGFGSLKLSSVTAADNSSIGYGGVVNAVSSTVDVQAGSYQNNSAASGGVFNGISNSTVDISDAELIGNESVYVNTEYDSGMGGGAINIYSGKLNISNTCLDGNKTGYYGGALIASKAEVVIDDNTVVKNSTGTTGAALSFRLGSTVKLENMAIVDNTSKSNGVLYVNGGTFEAINVTASGNVALNGGVLYASGASTQVMLNDLTWSGNTANSGGAGYVTDATVTAANCVFTENTANLGGAFYAKKGHLDMQGVEFTANNAVRTASGSSGNGGAIGMAGGTVVTDDTTTFTSNSAENHAGAIYVSYTTDTTDTESVSVPSSLVATGTAFAENSAMAGGAVSIRSDCSAELNNLTLTNNTVEGCFDTKNDGNNEGGGAVYVGFGSLTLNNVTATGNTASDFGGAIDAVDSTVNIIGGTYTENISNSGGMLHSISGSEIVIDKVEIKNNESVYENKEYNNSIGGGAICASGGSLNIIDTVLDSNKTKYYAGTILASDVDVQMSGNTEVKNSYGGTGGALYFKNTSVADISGVKITDNTATTNGVVYVNNSIIDMNNVTATGNKAANGGVLYASNVNTNIKVNDSTFTQNNANNGGIINVTNATVEFTDSTLSNNTAKNGAVIYSDNANISVSATDIKNNVATSNAGVAYATSGNITVTDSEISENAAPIGGAFWSELANITVDFAVVSNNTASSTGGVGYTKDGSFEIKNSTVTGNSAQGYAGVLYVKYTEVTFDASEFTANTSGNNGGVLYLAGAKGNVNDCTFTENSAVNHGGVIYDVYLSAVDTEEEKRDKAVGELYVTGSSFVDNTAMAGAAVSVRSGCDAVFNGTVFSGNSVAGFAGENDGDGEGGGVIYVGYGSTTLNDVTANNNTASDFGGVIESVSSTVTINGGSFSENSAVSGSVLRVITKSNVTVNNAEFTDNAGESYGVIYQNTGSITLSGVNASGNTALQGSVLYASNASVKVTVENSTFSNNTANLGGALNINSGTALIKDSTFTQNKAVKNASGSYGNGGAININAATVTASGNNVFESNTAQGHGGAVYVTYSTVNNEKVGGTLNMTDGLLKSNTAVSGGAISSRTNGTVVLEGTELTSNNATSTQSNEGGGAIYTNTNNLTLTGVTMDGNSSAYYAGAVLSSDATVTINGNSVIRNSAGATGAALVFINSSNGTVTDTEIVDNTASVNGVVYINNSTAEFDKVTATGNKASSGGVIFASNANTKITVTDSTITSNNATNGGVVNITNGKLDFVGGTIAENTAKYGAVVYSTNGKISIDGSTVTKNTASSNAGVVFATDGTVNIANADISENSATSNGGAMYVKYTTLTVSDTEFTNNASNVNGGVCYLAGSQAVVTDTDFTGNTATGHGGAFYTVYINAVDTEEEKRDRAVSDLAVTGGTFENNTAMAGAVTSIRTDCNAEFNGSAFIGNSVEGFTDENNNGDGEGGAAVYVGYGNVTLNDVTATGNSSSDFGGVVDAVASKVTINRGTYSENTTKSGAVVYATGKSTVIMTDVTACDNEAVRGGVLLANGSNVSTTVTGGEYKNNTAQLGGALNIAMGSLSLTDVKFTENHAVKNENGENGNGGAVVITAGTITATGNNVFEANTAQNHGGAVYVSYNTINNERVGGTLNMTNGVFENNTAFAGGAISSRTNCTVNLTGTELRGNSATSTGSNDGGGAIYSNDNTLKLSGVVMDGNSTGYYGGAITAVNGDVTINENSEIKNSIGTTGMALHFRGTGTYTLNGVKVTDNVGTKGSGVIYITNTGTLNITNLTATGNKNVNGGVVYASGSAKVNIDKSTFTGNTATGLGGAVDHRSSGALTITDSTFNNNTAASGAAINIGGSGAVTIKNSTIDGNTAKTMGAGIYHTGSGLLTIDAAAEIKNNTAPTGGGLYLAGSGATTIKNSIIDGNTATTFGGGIYHAGKGLLTVTENTEVKNNTAPSGGGLCVDLGAVASVSSATFDANSATSTDGGAILVADSSEEGKNATTLTITDSVLKENTAKSKGGAISTDTSSPNLVITAENCEFIKNSSLSAGGGAVEIQNGNQPNATDPTELKITFKNCTFTENSAATTGGAIEIRTSSSAKIDGITATKNKALKSSSGHGGVIYLTSNFSRLYLTGSVVLSGNTAGGSGTFAYLYNNKYTNPPKIYTTDSNTAAWYKEVKGNTSSVAFDLTTMP